MLHCLYSHHAWDFVLWHQCTVADKLCVESHNRRSELRVILFTDCGQMLYTHTKFRNCVYVYESFGNVL
jgi:hypothetical protein